MIKTPAVFTHILALTVFIALSSCSTDGNVTKSKYQRYQEAVEAVKYLTESDIRKLVLLKDSDPLSSVKGEDVILATFHDAPMFYEKGTDNELKIGAMWTVTLNEISHKMTSDSSNCSYNRIIELIGLAPDDTVTSVSVLRVKVKDLYRPAYNPDVTSQKMSFNLNSEDEDFVRFFKGNFVDNPYPWTALGYTYDYGKEDHYGVSEFVLLKGRHYHVIDTVRIEDYIQNKCRF